MQVQPGNKTHYANQIMRFAKADMEGRSTGSVQLLNFKAGS